MNIVTLLLVAAPTLFWDQGIDTAAALKKNGVSTIQVPPAVVDAWKRAGLDAHPLTPAELEARIKLPDPGIDRQVATLSPTQRPFVVANGWRFLRKAGGQFRSQPAAGVAKLAVAEALAFGSDDVLKIDPRDLPAAGEMFAFFRRFDAVTLPDVSQVGVVDDGTESVGEVMELLSRRNLLFSPVTAPRPEHALTIKLGTKEYPTKSATDPSEFAYGIRGKLTDDKRLIRFFGSETVLCRLVGDKHRARLYLVNYSGNPTEGLRVRLRGDFAKGMAHSDLEAVARPPMDHTSVKGVTEFTVPSFNMVAVVDLQ